MEQQHLSFLPLILNASWVVQLVMLLLLLASLASWAIIFQQSGIFRRVRSGNAAFEQRFWAGASLPDLLTQSERTVDSHQPIERVFLGGMCEFQKMRERRGIHPDAVLDAARRAMRVQIDREMDALESKMSWLASVGSVAPYVGLFGTVWGIMSTFTTFGTQTQVTLATVAPGIAEALVATAMGLFAAIPAVLAYNHFSRGSERISMQLENFMEEFSNILQRSLSAQS